MIDDSILQRLPTYKQEGGVCYPASFVNALNYYLIKENKSPIQHAEFYRQICLALRNIEVDGKNEETVFDIFKTCGTSGYLYLLQYYNENQLHLGLNLHFEYLNKDIDLHHIESKLRERDCMVLVGYVAQVDNNARYLHSVILAESQGVYMYYDSNVGALSHKASHDKVFPLIPADLPPTATIIYEESKEVIETMDIEECLIISYTAQRI